jgi:hypothetical protein
MSSSESNFLVNEYVLSFEELINLQKSAISSFKKCVSVLLLIGLIIIAGAALLYSQLKGLAPSIVGIGGFFISGCAAFPYREIIPRRSEIIRYGHIKRRLERFNTLTDEERKRTLDLADDLLKK